MGKRGVRTFESAQALRAFIEAHFDCLAIFEPAVDRDGQPVLDHRGCQVLERVGWKRIPTMAGLARRIGVGTMTLRRWQDDDEYSEPIKWAKQIVEEAHEEALFDSKTANGAKFSLNVNFGWVATEKHDVESKASVEFGGWRRVEPELASNDED